MGATMRNVVCAGVSVAILIAAASPAFAAGCPSPAGFPRWLQGFKQEGGGARHLAPDRLRARRLDLRSRHHRQGPRPGGVRADLPAILRPHGVQQPAPGRIGLLKKNAATFAKIQQQFGVPAPVLVAFWGLETDFGKVMGNMETLRSLATLAFDCRRPEEFKEQFLDALRVIERGDLARRDARAGHGEVGQFQFQPSIYYQYAVDFDGNGRRDLIRSTPDALASAANYLKGSAGRRVSLGSRKSSCRRRWIGARPTSPSRSRAPIGRKPASPTRTARRFPPTARRPRCCCPWGGTVRPSSPIRISTSISNGTSRSSIRLTAAYYATRLAGAPALSRGTARRDLAAAAGEAVQQLLAKRGYDVGKIDGVIGAATRNAIRRDAGEIRPAGRRLSDDGTARRATGRG